MLSFVFQRYLFSTGLFDTFPEYRAALQILCLLEKFRNVNENVIEVYFVCCANGVGRCAPWSIGQMNVHNYTPHTVCGRACTCTIVYTNVQSAFL